MGHCFRGSYENRHRTQLKQLTEDDRGIEESVIMNSLFG